MIRQIGGKYPHTVEVSVFKQFLDDEEVTFASSSREKKWLTVSLKGSFRVCCLAKGGIYTGTSPEEAVEAYNNITEKYITPEFKI
jgi:hypothetical protein